MYYWSRQLSGGFLKYVIQINKKSRRTTPSSENRFFYTSLTVLFLVPFILFNSGLMFDIGGFNEDTRANARIPGSNILSYGKIDSEYHNVGEVLLGSKLPGIINNNNRVYADIPVGVDLVSAWYRNSHYLSHGQQLSENSYLIMRSWNINHQIMRIPADRNNPLVGTDYITVSSIPLSNKDYIYNSGHASLYRSAL